MADVLALLEYNDRHPHHEHVVECRELGDDPQTSSLSSIRTPELNTLEYEGARAIWEATLAEVPWQQLVAEDRRQHQLREELAERLAAEPPRTIGQREIQVARAVAEVAHRTQTDKVGEPYLGHPLRVAERVKDDDETYVVALLHDVLEDGPYHQAAGTEFVCSMSAIARDVGPQIAVAVQRLTRYDSQPDRAYYAKIRGNQAGTGGQTG